MTTAFCRLVGGGRHEQVYRVRCKHGDPFAVGVRAALLQPKSAGRVNDGHAFGVRYGLPRSSIDNYYGFTIVYWFICYG